MSASLNNRLSQLGHLTNGYKMKLVWHSYKEWLLKWVLELIHLRMVGLRSFNVVHTIIQSLPYNPDHENIIVLNMELQSRKSRLNNSLLKTLFQVTELSPRPHVSISIHIFYQLSSHIFKMIIGIINVIVQQYRGSSMLVKPPTWGTLWCILIFCIVVESLTYTHTHIHHLLTLKGQMLSWYHTQNLF